jgi:hypothetical protein
MNNNESLQKPSCPQCGSTDVAHIVYGLPSPETLKRHARDKTVKFGGCCVSQNSPKWTCNKCGESWGVTRIRREGDVVYLE